MLRKLIKNELISTWKTMVLLHVILLIAAFIGRWTLLELFRYRSPRVLLILLLLASAVTLIFVSFATMFFIAFRFYSNLFSDQGYLMFTLPVTPTQLLISKFVSGSLWILMDMLVSYLAIGIVCFNPTLNFQIFMNEITLVFGCSFRQLFVLFILFSIAGCISSSLLIYVSIAIGQLFKKHRALVAVICYFIITMSIQIITTIVLLISGFFTMDSATGNPFVTSFYSSFICKLSILISVIATILSFITTWYIMNKKINLN
ncbi:MAG: hypothetical protein RR399_05170 [Lachnospiraceae bacterium]